MPKTSTFVLRVTDSSSEAAPAGEGALAQAVVAATKSLATAGRQLEVTEVHAQRKPRARTGKVRVGLIFNLRAPGAAGQVDEATAEFDSPETIRALREAIESHGHEVVELEATQALPVLLSAANIDVAFNIAEGAHGRGRESQVPALLELLGIPYTGSDPTTIGVCLDKALTKRVVYQAGVRTPPFVEMTTGREPLPVGFGFPAIVKPIAEGSSRGVTKKSVVHDEACLRQVVVEQVARYRQPMLVEGFLPGRELTVGVLGGDKPRVLAPLEVVFTETDEKHPVYGFEEKFYSKGIKLEVPAKIDDALQAECARVALQAFHALGCRDVARVDLRLDAQGQPCFIEANPLPGLSPGFSDLCLIAEGSGIAYRELIGQILEPALQRMRG